MFKDIAKWEGTPKYKHHMAYRGAIAITFPNCVFWVMKRTGYCFETACRMTFSEPSLNYMDFQEWQEAGIELVAQDWKCATYPQHKRTWYPNLSVLDSIFYQGWEATRHLVSTGN